MSDRGELVPCLFDGCPALVRSKSRGFCSPHMGRAFPCKVPGCPHRVSATSRSGYCTQAHRAFAEKTRAIERKRRAFLARRGE